MKLTNAIKSTIIYKIISALIEVAACVFTAYGFARFKFKGKGLMLGILFLTILVPDMMVLIPRMANYSKMDILGILGLFNKLTGIDLRPNILGSAAAFYLPSIFSMGLRSGIIIFIYIQFFSSFPKELEEAAWIDGASAFILTNEDAECLLDISGAFGCKISGMSFNGKRLGKNIHGIRLQWPIANGGGQEDTPNIDDCRISLFTGDGLHFDHVWCFSVRRSLIITNGGAGDGGTLPVSPDYGIIIKNCENTIVSNNTMHNGALVENIIEENNTSCIIEGNIGCLLSPTED